MLGTTLKPIRLSRANFVFLLVILLFVIPIVVIIVSYPSIYYLYMEHWVGPEMQRRYGFAAEWRDIQGGTLYVITSIRPGGPLAKMGFEVGDIPWEYHGGLLAFYGALQEADEGRKDRVQVMRASDVAKGNHAKRTILVRRMDAGRTE